MDDLQHLRDGDLAFLPLEGAAGRQRLMLAHRAKGQLSPAGSRFLQLVERLFALGLHRLYALTDSRNLPAQRLLIRLRFRQEALHVRSWLQGDDWFDEFAYARLASD